MQANFGKTSATHMLQCFNCFDLWLCPWKVLQYLHYLQIQESISKWVLYIITILNISFKINFQAWIKREIFGHREMFLKEKTTNDLMRNTVQTLMIL